MKMNEDQAKKIRAYALVQRLEETFKDLMNVWCDGGVEGMLEPNYPFNRSFDDQWADVRKWLDGMQDPCVAKPTNENEGVYYAFSDGKFIGEYTTVDAAVIAVYEDKKIDTWNIKNSGTDYLEYAEGDGLNFEVMHESDYRFHNGDVHPKDRRITEEIKDPNCPVCRHCGSKKVFLSDHEALERQDKPTGHIDSEVYADVTCDDCNEITTIVGKIEWVDRDKRKEPTQAEIYANKFPNGITSWIETHHEIVSAIATSLHLSGSVANKREEAQGMGGLWELGEELTDLFEQTYKKISWDEDGNDWIETIDAFINEHLKRA